MARYDIVQLLSLRDPRDIVVSHSHYVLENRRHPCQPRYVRQFPTPQQRLTASIRGFAADGLGRGLHSIRARLTQYLPWLGREDTHVVHSDNC